MAAANDDISTGVLCVRAMDGQQRILEVVSVTPVAERLLSVRACNIVGRSPSDALGPANAEILERVCASAESGQDYSARLSLEHGDGKIELSISAAPAGDLIAIMLTDLSPLLAVKHEQQRSEQRFRDIAESSSDWFWECDENLRLTFMSRAFYDATGFTPEDVIGKTRDEIGFQTKSAEEKTKRGELEQTYAPLRDLLSCATTPSGRTIYALVSGKPIFDDSGTFRGYRGATRNITDTQELQSALRQAESRARDFAEASSDWFWETDPNMRFSHISQRIEDNANLSPDLFHGVSLTELQPDGDTAVWNDHLNVLASQKPFRGFVFVVQDRDGQDTWYEISGKPVFASDGRFQGYRGVGSIVTERVKAEDAMRQFASIVAASDDAIISSDINGTVTHWNAAAERIYGIKAKDIIGQHRSNLAPSSEAANEMEVIHSRVLSGETIQLRKLKRRRPDGSEFWISLTFAPVYDGHGRIVSVAGVGRDISDMVAADKRRARDAEELRLITDAVPAAIGHVDEELRYTFVNQTAVEWLARPSEDLLGRKISDVLPADSWADKPPHAARAMRGERVDFSEHWTFPDGQTRGILGTYLPDLAPDGTVRGFYFMLLDQTEQLAAQDELAAKQAQLDLVANTVPAALGHLDRNLVFRFVNRTALQWYATPEHPMLGQHYGDAFPPEIAARVLPMAQRALAGEAVEVETSRVFEDGVERTVHIEMLPERLEDGSINGVVLLATDVSAMKAAEAELRKSKAQFELVANSVPAAIGYVDRNFVFRFANRSAHQWYSKGGQSLIGMQLGDHIPDAARREARARARLALTGNRIEFDARRLHSDGEQRDIHNIMTPDLRDDGTVEGLFLLAIDITAAKAREAEVIAKQRQLNRVANSVPAAIAQIDRDLTLQFVNDTAEKWYGERGQSLIGQRYTDILPPDAAERALPLLHRALAGEFIEFETDRVMKDGIRRVVTVSMTPEIRTDGGVSGVYILAMNVTRLKDAEEQLRRKERQLFHITNTTPVGIAEIDREMRVTFANELAQAWYGGDRVTVLGKTIDRFIPPDTLERIQPIIARALDGEASEFETTRTFADGVERTVSVRVTPDIDESDGIVGANLAITDITRQKALEADARAKADQLRLITDAMPALIAYCDRDLRYLFANKTAAHYHAQAADEIVGKHMSDLIGEQAVQDLRPMIDEVLSGTPVDFEVERQFGDGKSRFLHSHMVPDRDETGTVKGFYALLIDITKRKQAEDRVEAAAEQLNLIMDAVPAMIAYLDRDGRYRMVNRTYTEWLARPADQLIGRTPEHLWPPQVYERMKANIARVLQGETIRYDSERTFPDGSTRVLDLSLLPHFQADGTVAGWFILGTDVTERRKTEDTLRLQATTDPLTGVSNRRHFLEVGSRELARAKRYHHPFSMIVCDLDHFKKVNDTFGHDGGDEILIKFAELCCESVRGNIDCVGRLGGEEFALLLPETDAHGAKHVAERLRERCRETVCQYQGQELTFRSSMGVAQWEPREADLRAIMIRADAALYYSKENGRDRVTLAPMSSDAVKDTDAA